MIGVYLARLFTCRYADLSCPLVRRERKAEEGLFSPAAKRARLSPPLSQRVMLYVRQEREELYTPLHVVPPTTIGLLHAVSGDIDVGVVEWFCNLIEWLGKGNPRNPELNYVDTLASNKSCFV